MAKKQKTDQQTSKQQDAKGRQQKNSAKPAAAATAARAYQGSTNGANANSAIRSRTWIYAIAAVIIIIIAIAAVFVLMPKSGAPGTVGPTTVPFSTFKANLDSAANISVLLIYSNNTQQSYERQCYNYVLEVLGSQRSPKSISFFDSNQTSCVYSRSLGYPINISYASRQACINMADSTPGMVFNYTSSNTTVITAQRANLSGNAAFFNKCAIAADLT